MNTSPNWYIEELVSRLEVLQFNVIELKRQNLDSVSSIRRLARAIRLSSEMTEMPDLATAAADLEMAELADLPRAMAQLLSAVQSVRLSARAQNAPGVLILANQRETLAQLAQQLQSPNRRLQPALTVAEADVIVDEQRVDVIVLDLDPVHADAWQFLLRLRNHPAHIHTRIIVVSSSGDVRMQMECYALGADLYFQKSGDWRALAAAVSSHLVRMAAVSQTAMRDPMTGLLNRKALDETFRRTSTLAARCNMNVSIATLDLDHFKHINDTYGHPTGDEVIRRTTGHIIRALRISDAVARWGGEEFVVLFPDTEPAGAMLALKKALQRARAETFYDPGGKRPFHVSFSGGVAAVPQGATLEEAVGLADAWLYEAKRNGRSRIEMAPECVPSPAS